MRSTASCSRSPIVASRSRISAMQPLSHRRVTLEDQCLEDVEREGVRIISADVRAEPVDEQLVDGRPGQPAVDGGVKRSRVQVPGANRLPPLVAQAAHLLPLAPDVLAELA